jgi:hypothetical protein
VIRNDENRGFGAAVNQGFADARGDLFVVLNNDTIVAPDWLTGLARHLDGPGLGAVGPVTNRSGTEADVDVAYARYGEYLDAAGERADRHAGEARAMPMLAMFCIALRRDTFELIGLLDERFGLGMLEDDDYSVRLRRAGYRLACAEDVLVHHFGEASFGELFANGERDTLLRANIRRFADKWHVSWNGHGGRDSDSYRQLVDRIRSGVRDAVPEGAHVLVVSRGDERLLDLGRPSAHFPQTDGGAYAGYYPADSVEAIDQLERARQQGAEYLLFPQTSLWWLDHYDEFADHLRERYSEVKFDDDCRVFALDRAGGES